MATEYVLSEALYGAAEPLKFRIVSETALMVELGSEIKPEVIQRVHRLLTILDRPPPAGLEEITPAYSSLLVEFDPLKLSHDDVEAHVNFCWESIGKTEVPSAIKMEVPVFYGGEYGPDLAFCAEKLGMSLTHLISAHCDLKYTVAFFGFMPGFPYLHGWPSKWSQPRLDTARPKVPAGSVAIAGAQCGIYPADSPGGWRILGRSPLRVIDTSRDNFSPFAIGTEVRFYPANPSSW